MLYAQLAAVRWSELLLGQGSHWADVQNWLVSCCGGVSAAGPAPAEGRAQSLCQAVPQPTDGPV